MQRTVDMTVGSPTKHILKFSLPLIAANMGQQLYAIADASIVGRGVGVMALAAVGATDWIYCMILWTIIGLTQGFSTFVSRYFGEKDFTKVNKVIAMGSLLTGASGILLTVVSLLAVGPLLALMGTPTEIFGDATAYISIMAGGTVAIAAYNWAASVLRAFGDGKSPLIAMVIAAVLNIGLDLLFVFSFDWGIYGAAAASVTSQAVSFFFCLTRLKKIDCIRLANEDWKPDWSMIRDLLKFALPLALQFITIALGGIFLQTVINEQGSVFIAGYTATNKMYGLMESSSIALGLACSTFFAQNYGACLYKRVRQGMQSACLIAAGMAVVMMAFLFLIRWNLLQLFLDTSKENGHEALEIAVRYLSLMLIFLVVLYLIHVFRNALQALEISLWSMISGFGELFCRLFMAFVAIYWIGSDALFLAEPLAWFGALVFVMIPYFFYQKKLLPKA
jgi:putative MATE family efflux protein